MATMRSTHMIPTGDGAISVAIVGHVSQHPIPLLEQTLMVLDQMLVQVQPRLRLRELRCDPNAAIRWLVDHIVRSVA